MARSSKFNVSKFFSLLLVLIAFDRLVKAADKSDTTIYGPVKEGTQFNFKFWLNATAFYTPESTALIPTARWVGNNSTLQTEIIPRHKYTRDLKPDIFSGDDYWRLTNSQNYTAAYSSGSLFVDRIVPIDRTIQPPQVGSALSFFGSEPIQQSEISDDKLLTLTEKKRGSLNCKHYDKQTTDFSTTFSGEYNWDVFATLTINSAVYYVDAYDEYNFVLVLKDNGKESRFSFKTVAGDDYYYRHTHLAYSESADLIILESGDTIFLLDPSDLTLIDSIKTKGDSTYKTYTSMAIDDTSHTLSLFKSGEQTSEFTNYSYRDGTLSKRGTTAAPSLAPFGLLGEGNKLYMTFVNDILPTITATTYLIDNSNIDAPEFVSPLVFLDKQNQPLDVIVFDMDPQGNIYAYCSPLDNLSQVDVCKFHLEENSEARLLKTMKANAFPVNVLYENLLYYRTRSSKTGGPVDQVWDYSKPGPGELVAESESGLNGLWQVYADGTTVCSSGNVKGVHITDFKNNLLSYQTNIQNTHGMKTIGKVVYMIEGDSWDPAIGVYELNNDKLDYLYSSTPLQREDDYSNHECKIKINQERFVIVDTYQPTGSSYGLTIYNYDRSSNQYEPPILVGELTLLDNALKPDSLNIELTDQNILLLEYDNKHLAINLNEAGTPTVIDVVALKNSGSASIVSGPLLISDSKLFDARDFANLKPMGTVPGGIIPEYRSDFSMQGREGIAFFSKEGKIKTSDFSKAKVTGTAPMLNMDCGQSRLVEIELGASDVGTSAVFLNVTSNDCAAPLNPARAPLVPASAPLVPSTPAASTQSHSNLDVIVLCALVGGTVGIGIGTGAMILACLRRNSDAKVHESQRDGEKKSLLRN